MEKALFVVFLLTGCGYADPDQALRCTVWGERCVPKDGKDGVKGDRGADGTNGVNGNDGVNGVDGSNGSDGANGDNGRDGTNGIAGATGAQGEKGDKGDKGDRGRRGKTGQQGAPGTNGQDVSESPYDIVSIIDPCGDGPGFDEVILKLRNGNLIAHFASGQYQFSTLLTPGSYRTTDTQACRFTVNNDSSISY